MNIRSIDTGSNLIAAGLALLATAVAFEAQSDGVERGPEGGDGTQQIQAQESNPMQDIKVTAEVRMELITDQTLSATAQNVRIVTDEGKVTLQGEVSSTDERDQISTLVNQVAGSRYQVDNQIEVIN